MFDETARGYDAARRRLLPCFDPFYGAALGLLPFAADAPLRMVDLGAGTGLLSGLVAAAYPRARITLVDISGEMLALARQRLGGAARFDFVEADIAGYALPGGLDAVVSALAIHHLTDGDKRALYGRIRDSLRPGGVFVNAEQVRGTTPALDARNHDDWLAEVERLGVGEGELAEAFARMEQDHPATLADQLAWLRDAGFGTVECRFENGMFAVFGGAA